MQQGRGGMGSRKHGRSGQGGPSPKQKVAVAMAANQEIRRQQHIKTRRKEIGVGFSSVIELIESQGKRRF